MKCPKIPKKHFEVHNRVDPYCHKKIAKQYWFYLAFENSICKDYITGYSLLVAIIHASIIIKWRIVSQPSKIGNTKSLFLLNHEDML